MDSPLASGPSSAAEVPGRPLMLFCLGAATGVAAGNLLVPGWPWSVALVPLALLSIGWGLSEGRPALAWCAAGLLIGLASCALAPHHPPGASRLEVRFVAEIRDGWRASGHGYRARARILAIEHRGTALRHHREAELVVGGERAPRGLPDPGQRVDGSGELVFDRSWPLRRPVVRIKSALLMHAMAGGSAVDRLRQRLVEALQTAAGVDPGRIRAAGLAAALVLGRRELLPPGEVDALRRSGLAHLLAVSGLHVGMVSAIVWGALQLGGVRPRRRRWAVMAALVAFGLLAGGAPPVRRATLGGVLYLGMRQVGRPLVAFPAVLAVITTLLLFEPSALLDISFQLSALVTLALVRWAPVVSGRLAWPLGRAAPAVAVAAVAQAASLPLVGLTFARVPVAGPVVNLLAVPVGFVAVIGSLGACVASCFGAGPGGGVLAALSAVQEVLDHMAAAGGRFSATIPPPSAALVAALLLAGIVALGWLRRAWVAAVAVVVAFLAWAAWPGLPGRGQCAVRMLPVSDGMALLVSDPGDAVLVDAGRSSGEALAALASLHVRELAAVMVTHPDADHVGGVAAVLGARQVDALVYSAAEAQRPELVELRRVARANGTREVEVTPGRRLRFGGLVADVLWPSLTAAGDDNDRSLVALLTAGGVRLLLTGDLEAAGERALLSSVRTPPRAAILQLPHHGSATSSTLPFLRAVDATVALAATGCRPRYRYPAAATSRRVRLAGAVLVSQAGGIDTVTWRGDGELTIRSPSLVSVCTARGRAR